MTVAFADGLTTIKFFYFKCSTIYSSSKDYTSIELGFNISFSSPPLNLNSKNQSSSTICHPNAIYTSNSNTLATVATSYIYLTKHVNNLNN
ncbi:hypothetical protein C1645_827001 [Glomus cerebriforme]|uniref:Uncharacterized protein n=1 Tax=Glomus cerebriforme TaxID=658196 RepID=A0A397SP77_9GLOM|nr:hypothetical protein C1645_827001 [Glomus cerebriforme]